MAKEAVWVLSLCGSFRAAFGLHALGGAYASPTM
jgi:hypothetical protein